MKFYQRIFLFTFFSIAAAHADDFTSILQDLAVQTACIGQYSATQAGGTWSEDPLDYYKPYLLAERFKKMSGNTTRTITFYGVCFDYAEFAYWDIKDNESLYIKNGMRKGQFFLAGNNSNPNVIELSVPTSTSNATKFQNGIPVRTYGNSSYKNIKAHKAQNGTRATNHAWLWVMRNDGVWFWIDPTWTDNLGYVVYGYVSNGEEIQCRPDKDFCLEYPDFLKNLLLPPKMTEWNPSPASTSTSSSYNDYSGSSSSDFNYGNYNNEFPWIFGVSATAPYPDVEEKEFSTDKIGFSFDALSLINGMTGGFSIDYLRNFKDEEKLQSWLLSICFGPRLYSNLAAYVGGGLGVGFDGNKKEEIENSKETYDFTDSFFLSYKLSLGLVLNISSLVAKVELSFNDILGFSAGAGIMLGFGY